MRTTGSWGLRLRPFPLASLGLPVEKLVVIDRAEAVGRDVRVVDVKDMNWVESRGRGVFSRQDVRGVLGLGMWRHLSVPLLSSLLLSSLPHVTRLFVQLSNCF